MTNVECLMINGGIASLNHFRTDRSAKKAHSWQNTLFDAYSPPLVDSTFICFFTNQTGRLL
ncbi:hypothetical protein D1AOALGA4SA_7919 [Olavius algarvensis Delta 1 endosymbiont]|nr:hypothetical protein D1AOALGA4SA_7919 [Olavius algarvensis Delta 1 endosymbiont]